jgi:hypothetical protein
VTAEDNFRLGKVEARVEEISTGLHQLRGDVRDLHQLRADMRDIRESLHKQRGFIAGFSAAFAFIWTVAGAVFAWFWNR